MAFNPRHITAEAILTAVDKTARAFRSAEKNASAYQQKMALLSKRMVKVGAVMTTAISLPIIGFMAKSIKLAAEEQKALARVEHTARGVGNRSRKTWQDLEAMAERMQQSTESVESFGSVMENAIGPMLKFGRIQGETFDKAVQNALDASAALNRPLGEMSDMIGKALQDPIRGMRQLRELGINFDTEQQKRMASMIKAGKLAQVQRILLGRLEKQFQGAARAATKTWDGMISNTRKHFVDFMQNIGGVLIQGLQPLLPVLDRWSEWLRKMPPEQQKVTVQMGLMLAAAGPLIVALGAVAAGLTRLGSALAFVWRYRMVTGMLTGLAVAGWAVYRAWDKLNPQIERMGRAFKNIDTEGLLAAFRDFDAEFTKSLQESFGLKATGKVNNFFFDLGKSAGDAFANGIKSQLSWLIGGPSSPLLSWFSQQKSGVGTSSNRIGGGRGGPGLAPQGDPGSAVDRVMKGHHPLSRGGAPGGFKPAGGKFSGKGLGSNTKSTMAYLMATEGLTKAQAAGVTAGLMGESLGNPADSHWDRNGPSIGIASWHDVGGQGRATDLKNFAKTKGKMWQDLTVQHQNLSRELHGKYAKVLRNIKGAKDERQALAYWVDGFEKPADIPGQIRARSGNLPRLMAGNYSPNKPAMARNLGSIAARGSSGASSNVSIGKGRLDVNLKLSGQPASVERIHVQHPDHMAINTGIDNTGARLHRPGGHIGPV